jgi:lipoprotein-releasing system ATP-binding protein
MIEARGAAIRIVDLAMVYRSGQADLAVFSGANFSVSPGERVAVIGESGVGKSTLLHLLGGLDRPTSGKVYYDSADIFAWPDAGLARFRNREIGFVWQQRSLLPEFTAEENIMMPRLIRGEDREAARREAREMLEAVGLSQRGWHRAGELSGGEQQRVALARALVTRPRTLLADEPTGSLDYKTAGAMAQLLESLHRTLGFTAVVVTHNLAFARSFDTVLQLEKGVFHPWGGRRPDEARAGSGGE